MLVELQPGSQYELKQFPQERKKIDIGDYYADFSLIEQRLGWRPQTKLREALGKTLDYYRAELPHYV